MQSAKIVRVIPHETNVQVLCADDHGLVSVYFQLKLYMAFYKLIRRAGLQIADLEIEFNRELVRVPVLGKSCRLKSPGRKTLKAMLFS